MRRPSAGSLFLRWRSAASLFTGRAAPFAKSEDLLDRAAQGLEDLHACPPLVVRLDEVPGRELGARAIDHVAHRALVSRPLLAVAPVLLGDLEALEGRLLALLEAPELLLLAHREPELHDDDAEAHQRMLEVDDLAVRAHPVRLGGEAFDALDEHPAVPAPVEDGEGVLSRHVAPEPPQIRLRALLLGGRGNGDDTVLPGVERAGH